MSSSTDIRAWLDGLGLGDLAPLFDENHITPDILPTLTIDDLREIGVSALGHRKKLLAAVAALNTGGSPEAPSIADVPVPDRVTPSVTSRFDRAGPSIVQLSPAAPVPVGTGSSIQTPNPVKDPARITTTLPQSKAVVPSSPLRPPDIMRVNPAPPIDNQAVELALPLPTPGAAKSKRKAFSGSFLAVSICAHLILGLGAGFWVVQRIEAKRKLQFTSLPPTANPSKRALEHKVSLQKKKNAGGAPAQARRIAVTGVASNITLPDMPSVPTSAQFVAGRMAGMGGAGFGTGLGFGNGSGMGVGGMGKGGLGLTMFGTRGGGVGLPGTFYDLKQTKSRRPSGVDAESYNRVVRTWVAGGLKPSGLRKYFQAPQKLYATQFVLPHMSASEAPKAYGVEEEVQPTQWVAHYKGKVSPPKSGTYQFIGAADDVLVVRFKGEIVLDGSWFAVSDLQPAGIDAKGNYGNFPRNGYVKGSPFKAEAGQWYDIDVVIGERPGGLFFACLCVEEVGKNGLPLFRLSSGKLPEMGNPPPCDINSPIWKVSSGSGSPLDRLNR